MTRTSVWTIACTLASLTIGYGQTFYISPTPAVLAESYIPPGENGDDEKDPGHKTYKEGYALVLADKWSEAMKKMAEVKSKFPKSGYIDDAAYWSAYAQKRLDPKKGTAAFELFLAEYPESSYADDALAESTDGFSVTVSGDADNLKVRRAPGAYAYSYGSTMRSSEKAMRQSEQAMREVERAMRRSSRAFTPQSHMSLFSGAEEKERKLDPQTRIKLAALQALGESENDKEAFAALKDVALDKSQPEVLRVTAIRSLQDFRKFDVLPVLVDVARADGSEDIQLVALVTLGDLGGDKNKSVDALISLFNGYPKAKEKHLESALYAIADVGNDKAVDFLVKIATSNDSIDLRSDAVYYLGNIGNEKSRAALMQILKSK